MSLCLVTLREFLSYDAASGEFVWLKTVNRKARAGDKAGVIEKVGYRRIGFGGKLYLAHRLAWFYVNGTWPKLLDHINGDKADNRIANLREATDVENQQNRHTPKSNNSTGLMGVTRQNGRWKATIYANKVRKHLGYFDTSSLAHAAYLVAKQTFRTFGVSHG